MRREGPRRTIDIRMKSDPRSPYHDPNDPSSPDYAERNRKVSYEIMPGLMREDIGCAPQ